MVGIATERKLKGNRYPSERLSLGASGFEISPPAPNALETALIVPVVINTPWFLRERQGNSTL
jgi:hypothetical protein